MSQYTLVKFLQIVLEQFCITWKKRVIFFPFYKTKHCQHNQHICFFFFSFFFLLFVYEGIIFIHQFLISEIEYFQVQSTVQTICNFEMSQGERLPKTESFAVKRTRHTGSKDCFRPGSYFHGKQNSVEEKYHPDIVHFDILIHRFLCDSSVVVNYVLSDQVH